MNRTEYEWAYRDFRIMVQSDGKEYRTPFERDARDRYLKLPPAIRDHFLGARGTWVAKRRSWPMIARRLATKVEVLRSDFKWATGEYEHLLRSYQEYEASLSVRCIAAEVSLADALAKNAKLIDDIKTLGNTLPNSEADAKWKAEVSAMLKRIANENALLKRENDRLKRVTPNSTYTF